MNGSAKKPNAIPKTMPKRQAAFREDFRGGSPGFTAGRSTC